MARAHQRVLSRRPEFDEVLRLGRAIRPRPNYPPRTGVKYPWTRSTLACGARGEVGSSHGGQQTWLSECYIETTVLQLLDGMAKPRRGHCGPSKSITKVERSGSRATSFVISQQSGRAAAGDFTGRGRTACRCCGPGRFWRQRRRMELAKELIVAGGRYPRRRDDASTLRSQPHKRIPYLLNVELRHGQCDMRGGGRPRSNTCVPRKDSRRQSSCKPRGTGARP